MAPRKSRRSAAAAHEAPPADDSASAQSDAEEVPAPSSPDPTRTSASGLRFNETLLGRPGRQIPVATLLKRLQTLAEELKSLEQAESDDFKESCKPVAKELSDTAILNHKDKGVRAYAAQCIVDLLALCAPDAPFNTQALKAAFELIIKTIFPALADPSNAYNAQHIYVLDSLAEVKSILLIQDLPTGSKLITQLFTTFFDIYAGTARAASDEPVSKHVEYNMLNIMVTLVDEAESLPQEVVDIIVAQFLRADPKLFSQREAKAKKSEKSDENQALIRKELPTAYVAAKNICTMVPEKMAREISKYFSDVIMEASGANADGSRRKSSGDVDDVEDTAAGPSEDDLQDLQKAHRLVRELWRACPPVLQSVVPQLEAELTVENVQLRILATETLGDMISGIGAAGPPPPPQLDPSIYPPLDLARTAEINAYDPLTTPASPQSFPQTHLQAYQSFLGRRQDKSASVRSAWITAISRILSTNAGGVGLNHAEEKRLVEETARMLNDGDEKVRIATVKAIGLFSVHDAINKLGVAGGIDQEGSVFANLAAHMRDKRHLVRIEAMQALARLWAAAHGEIAEKNEQVITTIGSIPKAILDVYYIGTPEMTELIEKVLFEILLPLNYPPVKPKGKEKSNSSSQKTKESLTAQDADNIDPDQIRAERMLVLVKGLNDRSQNVFMAICKKQAAFSKYVLAYLASCEAYNGGVMDEDEKGKEGRLTYLIEEISKLFEDRRGVYGDLWKFAKAHDRRSYQLIKFCIEPKSDYRTIVKAMRELSKRIADSSNSNLMETLTPILYRASLIIYNRSNVPAILQFSKTNEKDLAASSHLLLKDISDKSPAVLETHIQEMCQNLMDAPPTAGKPNDITALDNLKACAAFARGYPHKMPKDKKFGKTISSYTLYGSPPEVGKHAVSVILGSADKKSAAAKDILKSCLKGFEYGQEGFLTRLASISQVMLLAPEEAGEFQEQVFNIVMEEILTKVRTESTDRSYVWTTDIDEECIAKSWAIKVVVNRIRSYPDADTLQQVADPILATLSYIVANEGDLSPAKDTPATQKPQLRLLAAHSILKLCRAHRLDQLLDPLAFVKLAEVVQDGLFEVRNAFIRRLRKYVNRGQLPARFYTIPFFLAYEPTSSLKTETITWVKSRAQLMKTQSTGPATSSKSPKPKPNTVMEATLARLISMLAHHQDYDPSAEGLLEIAQYILLYLTAVASSDNISLIYHIAQRIKGHQDAVLGSSTTTFATRLKPSIAQTDFSTRLHTLSDLACASIRAYVEVQGWNLQTLPSRASLPRNLFQEIKDHDQAIAIAEKDFLPGTVTDNLDALVRNILRRKPKGDVRKRKSEAIHAGDDEDGNAKRTKRVSTGKTRGEKTPRSAKKARTPKGRGQDWGSGSEDDGGAARDPESEKNRRKSGRASNATKYAERDDSEDDEEMLNGVAEWQYENGERQREESDEDEDDDDDEEDESQEEEQPNKSSSIPKARSRAKHIDEDVEMTDGSGGEGSGKEEPTSSPPTPVTTSPAAPQRGQATSKVSTSKKASSRSSTLQEGKKASQPSARSGRAAAKASKETSSPLVEKSNQKALPTRSGRSTRSRA